MQGKRLAARRLAAAGFVAAALGTPAAAQTQVTGAPGATAVEQGKYLTIAGDCAACHTAPGGQKFAGGLKMDMPFGELSTPNITPDKATGIGDWTDDQFYRVFHAGVGKNGEFLYPAMPYPWFTHLTRSDVLAIKAYLFSLAPVRSPRVPSHIAFPFNIRTGLGAWDAAFLQPGEFKPDPGKSAQVNRGDYLVNGLGHCGECHNNRNMLGATSVAAPLQGGPLNKWYAPNLTSDKQSGLGRYSDQDVFTYLKTGTDTAMGVVAGPMGQTVHESLRAMSDDDVHAIVAYLKQLPAKPSYKPVHDSVYAGVNSVGAQVYLNNCASCHQGNGLGIAGVVPKLVDNGAVVAAGPQDVIRVILGGISAQGSYAPMPGVGVGMTDQEIAAVTNYVRQSWGNAAPPNAGSGEVATLRGQTHTLWNATAPQACPALAQPAVSKAVADPSTGIADLLKGTTLVNMVPNVDTILGKVATAAPGVKQADLINALTIAYCPVVLQDSRISPQMKRTQLDQFGERVYTQLVDKGAQ